METTTSVYVKRNFNCDVETLFDWVSNADLIAQWFGPKHLSVVNVTAELNVGGIFCNEMAKPDGSTFFIEGNYIEIDRPNKLVFSFGYRGLQNPPPNSIVTLLLSEDGRTKSTLRLTQQFEVVPSDMKNRTVAWEHMMDELAKAVD